MSQSCTTAILEKKEKLTVYGWVRLYVEEEYEMDIADTMKDVCLSFYGVLYIFNEESMNSKWSILPYTRNLKAALRGNGWQYSNIFLRPILKVGSGEYQLEIQYFKRHRGLVNNFVIGICPLLLENREIEGNFANEAGSYCMCASGAVMPSKLAICQYDRDIVDGDVIYVYLDMNEMTLGFGANGQRFAIAFRDIIPTDYVFAFASYCPCNVDIV